MRPQDAGLPVGQHRRVEGLRREELAMLAGISVDYVVRLEQARAPQPSVQVLSSLCRALRLADDERDLLFHLAGAEPPRPGLVDLHVRPSVLRLVDRFGDLPTVVLSAKGDVLAWNAMSSALLGDWTAVAPARRNWPLLRFLPRDDDPPRTPVGGPPEEVHAADVQSVAGLRSAAGRYPDDPAFARLLEELMTGSGLFRELWDDGATGAWRSQTKTLVHPVVGELVLECDTLVVPDVDQTVHVNSAAPGTPAAEGLALLRVLGTQEMAAPV